MHPEPYDFRKPAPLPAAVRASLADWLPRAAQAVSKLWSPLLPFAVEVEPGRLEVIPATQALERAPESALRFEAGLGGAGGPSLLVLPRPLVLALLGGLLGEEPDPAQPDRELTPIEEQVSDFIAREHVLKPLQQAWPLTPKVSLDPPARLPSGASPFPAGALVLAARLTARGPFGDHECLWLLPRSGWLDAGAGPAAEAAGPSREERESLVRALPVRLTVRLGLAHLSLVRLASLAEGDVLLLEQPVDRPLTATLGGREKYLVWPGAVGARQAVAIHSPLEPEP